MRKPEIEDRVRNVLMEKFPLYENAHSVMALSRKDVFEGELELFIGYHSSPEPFTTGFNLQISENQGDILTFFIDEGLRGKGHGRQLYDVVTLICKEQGCASLRVAPSGDGLKFWPAMGFTKYDETWLESRI